MFNQIFETILSESIWTILSFVLIYYILKIQEKRDVEQEKREKNYQKIILEISSKFEIIHAEVKNIKENLIKK